MISRGFPKQMGRKKNRRRVVIRFYLVRKMQTILNHLKIRQKLLVMYAVAFLLPLLLIAVVMSSWLYGILEKWQISQAQTSLSQTAILFQDMIQSTEEISDSLYNNRAVNDTLGRTFSSVQEVYDRYMELDFLDDFLHSNTDILIFRYYTENNSLLNNSYFIKATDEVKTSSWYRNARLQEGKITWQMKTDSITRQRMLVLTRAVFRHPDKKFLGVMVIYLNSDRISRLLVNYENETFISINGMIEFSSTGIPRNKRVPLAKSGIEKGESSVLKSKYKEENVVALMTCLLRERSNSIILTQIIPKRTLFQTTLTGILISVLIMFSGSLISLILIQIFSRYFSGRINYLNGEINKVVQKNFELGPRPEGCDEFTEIYDALATTSNNIKTLIDEIYQHKLNQEQLLSRQNDIRFKMLASQINPHFLFNTLETIRMQALADGNRNVAHTIKLLAKILRHNLDVSESPVAITEEIEAVSNYLDIQHLRFSNRVSYDIIFMTDVTNIGILPLLIQPLVENSFSHGLESTQTGGFIYIVIDSDKDGDLSIIIKDNGCGISVERLGQLRERLATGTVENFTTSIGMVNVNQRIKLFYGEKYGIELESELNKGTTVTIHVPRVSLAGKGETNG